MQREEMIKHLISLTVFFRLRTVNKHQSCSLAIPFISQSASSWLSPQGLRPLWTLHLTYSSVSGLFQTSSHQSVWIFRCLWLTTFIFDWKYITSWLHSYFTSLLYETFTTPQPDLLPLTAYAHNSKSLLIRPTRLFCPLKCPVTGLFALSAAGGGPKASGEEVACGRAAAHAAALLGGGPGARPGAGPGRGSAGGQGAAPRPPLPVAPGARLGPRLLSPSVLAPRFQTGLCRLH